jgi:hypothetical protein
LISPSLSQPIPPVAEALVVALTARVKTTVEGYYRWRDTAIGTVRRAGATSTVVAAPDGAREPPARQSVFLAAMSVFVEDEKERPGRCFLCVGAALAKWRTSSTNATLPPT